MPTLKKTRMILSYGEIQTGTKLCRFLKVRNHCIFGELPAQGSIKGVEDKL